MMSDHIEKRGWSLGVDMGSPRSNPATTVISTVTILAVQRNQGDHVHWGVTRALARVLMILLRARWRNMGC